MEYIRAILHILFNFSIVVCSYSQLPQEESLQVRGSKEVWLGAVVHSNGFGVNLDVAKFKTYKKKNLLHAELVNMKHPKEYKMLGFGDESAKKYVFVIFSIFLLFCIFFYEIGENLFFDFFD